MFACAAGVHERVLRADQRGTPDTAVGRPAPATGRVQRPGLGGAAEAVVHGPDVVEAAHVPGPEPRARAGHPGLGPGRDPDGRVRRAQPRGQPERVEQQDRLGAEPGRGPRQPHQAPAVQRQPRAGQPAEGRVRAAHVRRLHRGGQPLPVRLPPVPVPGRPPVRQHVVRPVHRQELLHIAARAQRAAGERRQAGHRGQVPAVVAVRGRRLARARRVGRDPVLLTGTGCPCNSPTVRHRLTLSIVLLKLNYHRYYHHYYHYYQYYYY